MVVAHVNVRARVHGRVIRGVLLLHVPVHPPAMGAPVVAVVGVVTPTTVAVAIEGGGHQQARAPVLRLLPLLLLLVPMDLPVGLSLRLPPATTAAKGVLLRPVRQVEDAVQLIEMVCIHLILRATARGVLAEGHHALSVLLVKSTSHRSQRGWGLAQESRHTGCRAGAGAYVACARLCCKGASTPCLETRAVEGLVLRYSTRRKQRPPEQDIQALQRLCCMGVGCVLDISGRETGLGNTGDGAGQVI